MSLKEALLTKNVEEIRRIASGLPIADLADMLEELAPQERVLFFMLLKTQTQSEIFAQLEPQYQAQLIRSFTDEQIDEIVGDLYADEIVDLIEEVPAELQKTIILSIHDKQTREKVNRILKFDEEQTGSVMNVDLVLLSDTQTIAQALSTIRKAKDDARLAHYFFVVNAQKELQGFVALEDMVFGNQRSLVKFLVKPSPFVYTTTNKSSAANEFAKYGMSVLPVLNNSKEVVGMITSDDVIDIVTESATHDAHMSAGIISDTKHYSETSVWKLFRSRVLWLMLLMISATLSQIVLDVFQKIADKNFGTSPAPHIISAGLTSAIVAILPVISGAAGNAGSQSSTMVIRALAIGDISVRDYLKVLFKELGTSNIMGITLAIANFARLAIYYGVSGDLHGSDVKTYLVLSAAASLSLFIVIVLANLVGGMLPLFAKALRLDPAVMAAPLLTTLIDALSTMIFFGISIGIMVLTI